MKTLKMLCIGSCLALCLAMSSGVSANLQNYGRQYYSSWNYYPSRGYHYSYYYYKPQPDYASYNHHYCVHYPSQPRYVYYYNPYSQAYWGRFDTEGKDGAQYSLLKQEDRKKTLKEIPESAFPKPASMPGVPESEDGETIAPIKELPKATN